MFADMVILILEQILAFVREIPTDQMAVNSAFSEEKVDIHIEE